MSTGQKGPSCPECGRPATGNFCQHCGAELGGRFCNQCGAKVAGGARFCNQCGNPLAGSARAGAGAGTRGGSASASARGPDAAPARRVVASAAFGQSLPWWIAGVAMFALIVFVGVSMVRPGAPAAPGTAQGAGAPTAAPGAAGTGVPPDISSMTPIEAADRLFERVMTATSAGDSAQAQAFLPMAIAAYQRARPLNLDGLFHLSMLNRTAMNLEAALDAALEILEQDPDHLLGLAAAAEAAIELGEPDEAEKHYRHLLDVYDEQMALQREEYIAHVRIVEAIDQDAERYLAGR